MSLLKINSSTRSKITNEKTLQPNNDDQFDFSFAPSSIANSREMVEPVESELNVIEQLPALEDAATERKVMESADLEESSEQFASPNGLWP